MSAEPDYIHYVVIGCGINVNQEEFPSEISRTATSLRLEKGEKISRSALLVSVMDHFEEAYGAFRKTWDLTELLPSYHRFLLNKDARVRVLDPKGNLTELPGESTKKESFWWKRTKQDCERLCRRGFCAGRLWICLMKKSGLNACVMRKWSQE